MKVTAHRMIEQLAREMCETAYDEWASHSNEFYKLNPKRGPWVRKNTILFLDPAREALAKMLASPEYDEFTKNKIYQALVLDNQFKHARARAVRGDVVYGV